MYSWMSLTGMSGIGLRISGLGSEERVNLCGVDQAGRRDAIMLMQSVFGNCQ